MKIGYVFTAFPVRSQSFAIAEIISLVELGHEVKVFRQEEKWSQKDFQIEDIDLIKNNIKDKLLCFLSLMFFSMLLFIVKNSNTLKEFIRALTLIPSSISIVKAIEREQLDTVHLFWSHYPALVAFGMKKKYKNSFKFSTFSGAYDMTGGYGLTQWSIKNADIVLTHCRVNEKYIMEKWNIKALTFYRGVNVNKIIDNQKNISRERKVIIASRLIEIKRVDLAIDTFAIIQKIWPDVKLVIAGDGPLKESLKKYAESNLLPESYSFLGYIKQSKLLDIFSSAEITLLPSESSSERLPNVIKEAMAVGCIPITSNSIGIDELITNEEDGFVLEISEFRDPIKIKHILYLIDMKGDEIRKLSKAKIVESFDNSIISRNKISEWERIS